jgi:uncharacterized membrane protein
LRANGRDEDAQTGGRGRDRFGRLTSVEDLTRRNVEVVAELENAAKSERTVVDRIVDAITAFCGSVTFVWLHVLWFGGWIVLNTLPGMRHFDPFPFQFLTLVVSLEAILLSTFILITQNRQAQLADRRNHLDLQINMLSEQENTKMLSLLHAIAKRLDVDECNDPELNALERDTHVGRVVKQIEQNIEREGDGEVKSAAF